jgi:hypothetical protein
MADVLLNYIPMRTILAQCGTKSRFTFDRGCMVETRKLQAQSLPSTTSA